MKQQTIFDYIDLEQDAVYLTITQLKINEGFIFGSTKVTMIDNHYEVECEYCHEFYKNTLDCYKRLIEIDNMAYNELLEG